MKNKFIYGIYLLIIPLLTLLVTSLCEVSLNYKLRSSLNENNTYLSREEINKLTVRDVIAFSDASELGDLRAEINTFDLINLGSKIAIITAVIYSILLLFFGWAAKVHRFLLLLFFKPFFYLSIIILFAFTIINGALIVATLYFAESYLLGMVHVFIIGSLGIGAISGAVIIVRSMLTSLQKVPTNIIGLTLSKDKFPKIWESIGVLAENLGTELPQNIVAGLDPNFFVTEANVNCLDGALKGRTLYISLPLLRLLNKDQFDGVIGHEFGHFIGNDTKYSKRFYPEYRGLFNTLYNLENSVDSSIALVPAHLMLSVFLNSFSNAERKLSRQRELLADKTGVKASSELSFASALVRIVAFASYWESLQENTKEILSQEKMIVNISDYFAAVTPTIITEEALEELSFDSLPHPTDTHPPIHQRIELCGYNLKLKMNEFVGMEIHDSAINLIDNYEEIECELSDAYQSILSRDLN